MDDPFEQMNFIILKLMPAVLEEQEQSIAEIAPLIEENKEYNDQLTTLQKQFGGWGLKDSGGVKEKVDESEKGFFTTLTEMKTSLEKNEDYGVGEEMVESLDRIDTTVSDARSLGRKGDLNQEQVAYNSLASPGAAYQKDGDQPLSYNYEDINKDNSDYAREDTSNFQPVADQVTSELEILKGLNTNLSKQLELDLKYQVEFYNSYVSSIGSMEDNTSKQRRSPIDRMLS